MKISKKFISSTSFNEEMEDMTIQEILEAQEKGYDISSYENDELSCFGVMFASEQAILDPDEAMEARRMSWL